jgi:hypothetical protein
MKNTVASTAGSQTGQLHHITEEHFVDAETDETPAAYESNGNYTNKDALLYFTRLSNHYLRLVKNSPSMLTADCHHMSFPVIAGSGANYHMFKEREFFDTFSPASGYVLLGVGKTALPIQGVGTITCQIRDHILTIPNVHYKMDLSKSIYSLFVHIKNTKSWFGILI